MSKKHRSDPEIEIKALEAHARGARIEDLDYDEVTGLLDVVAKRSKEITDTGTAKLRELAARIDAAKGIP